MAREMYTNVGNYKRTSQWTLDSTETALRYFSQGMSKADVLAVMEQEQCKLSIYPPTRPNRISCHRRIKGAFMGIRLPFFNTYKVVVIIDMKNNKIDGIKSVINLETIYG